MGGNDGRCLGVQIVKHPGRITFGETGWEQQTTTSKLCQCQTACQAIRQCSLCVNVHTTVPCAIRLAGREELGNPSTHLVAKAKGQPTGESTNTFRPGPSANVRFNNSLTNCCSVPPPPPTHPHTKHKKLNKQTSTDSLNQRSLRVVCR